MISVVIPNYNGEEHLKGCINSLKRQNVQDFRLILVDNGSEDNSVSLVKSEYPESVILEFGHNTGFAKAVNEGIRFSLNGGAEYILLLNNDTECDERFLEEMLSGFGDSRTGSVACKMLNYYNRDVIDDAGDFIKIKGSPYARGHGEKDEGQYDREEFIFGACAGAALYKSEVFTRAGYFDEDFFAYYEDVDFSLRLQLMGYRCFYNPRALCYHKRGATTSDRLGFQTELCEKNLIALRLKNYPALLLLKYSFYFFFARIRRYYRFKRDFGFSLFRHAFIGYLRGLAAVPSCLKKRKHIQELRKISTKEFEALLK